MIGRPPTSTLFPYPTLFRSQLHAAYVAGRRVEVEAEGLARLELHPPAPEASDPELRPLHVGQDADGAVGALLQDRKSTRLNSSHANISYAVFCLKKKKQYEF